MMTVQCCICKCVIREGDGSTDLISHGFCPSCAEAEMRRFEEELRKMDREESKP